MRKEKKHKKNMTEITLFHKIRTSCVKHWFFISCVAILLLAASLRFYNFSHHWGLASDDMRDIAIAKEALWRKEVPLIGSFSSAGPFVFGPLFYWFIMVSYIVLPFFITTPWIFLVLLYIITVGVFLYIGYLLGGRQLAIITGSFAAVSPQLVNLATALTQHSLVVVFSSFALLFFIFLYQRKKIIFAFFLGVSIGTAISMHYQALNLFIFLPFLFLTTTLSVKNRLYAILLLILGFLIPSFPLLLWDSRQQWANIRNILDYFLIAQYRLYVPNSWKLFLLDFLANYWGYEVGGFAPIAFFLFILSVFFFLLDMFKKKLPHIIFLLYGMFLFLILINRYYRGERFFGYMLYLSPFIILFSSWVIFKILSVAKTKGVSQFQRYVFLVVGFLLFVSVIYGSLLIVDRNVFPKNNRIEEIQRLVSIVQDKYPNKKFKLYDFQWMTSDISYPLSAFLKEKDKTHKTGIPIGIIRQISFQRQGVILASIRGSYVIDLTGKNITLSGTNRWVPVNQEDIYNDLMQWTKTRKLSSSFDLISFIRYKL